jgi:hypothetical protein
MARTRGGIFGLFGDSATLLGLASTVVIALIVVYMAREGTRSALAADDRPGAAARRRGGQPDRPAAAGLCHRLRSTWASATCAGTRSTSPTRRSARSLLLLVLIALFGERLPAHDGAPAEAKA